MTDYQANRLSVIDRIIKRLERDKDFLWRNIRQFAAIGLFSAFVAPFFGGGAVLAFFDNNYEMAFFSCLSVYISLFLLGHFVFNYKDNLRIQKLKRIRRQIEDDIANNRTGSYDGII